MTQNLVIKRDPRFPTVYNTNKGRIEVDPKNIPHVDQKLLADYFNHKNALKSYMLLNSSSISDFFKKHTVSYVKSKQVMVKGNMISRSSYKLKDTSKTFANYSSVNISLGTSNPDEMVLVYYGIHENNPLPPNQEKSDSPKIPATKDSNQMNISLFLTEKKKDEIIAFYEELVKLIAENQQIQKNIDSKNVSSKNNPDTDYQKIVLERINSSMSAIKNASTPLVCDGLTYKYFISANLRQTSKIFFNKDTFTDPSKPPNYTTLESKSQIYKFCIDPFEDKEITTEVHDISEWSSKPFKAYVKLSTKEIYEIVSSKKLGFVWHVDQLHIWDQDIEVFKEGMENVQQIHCLNGSNYERIKAKIKKQQNDKKRMHDRMAPSMETNTNHDQFDTNDNTSQVPDIKRIKTEETHEDELYGCSNDHDHDDDDDVTNLIDTMNNEDEEHIINTSSDDRTDSVDLINGNSSQVPNIVNTQQHDQLLTTIATTQPDVNDNSSMQYTAVSNDSTIASNDVDTSGAVQNTNNETQVDNIVSETSNNVNHVDLLEPTFTMSQIKEKFNSFLNNKVESAHIESFKKNFRQKYQNAELMKNLTYMSENQIHDQFQSIYQIVLETASVSNVDFWS